MNKVLGRCLKKGITYEPLENELTGQRLQLHSTLLLNN